MDSFLAITAVILLLCIAVILYAVLRTLEQVRSDIERVRSETNSVGDEVNKIRIILMRTVKSVASGDWSWVERGEDGVYDPLFRECRGVQ
jgi:hypothetical protein